MPSEARIVLSHPGTGIFVQQSGQALHEAGLLKRFVTTLVDRPKAFWRPWLPGRLDNVLKKRAITEFPVGLARTYPPRELLRLLTREIDWTGGVLSDEVWEWAEYGFDRWVARHALDGADAVYGYEHACLQTFRRARGSGMTCFYEVPAPEAGYAQRIRDAEIAVHPELDSAYEQRLRRTRGKRQERRWQEWELADTVIASSQFTKSTYHDGGYDVSRVRVIPLAAPPVCAESLLNGRAARRGAHGPLRVLSMGSFALHKGSHHLLAAWRQFNAGDHARLDVVGGVGLPGSLLRDLPESVHLRGAVAPTAAREVYGEADVLVFPTLADGFGMVVSEALSQGVPVITTPQAGAAEMITHGSNGLIVPSGDPVALAEALRWCLDNRETLATMGWRARESAARWQWADYRQALAEAVRTGLAAAPPGGSPLRSDHKGRPTVCLITSAHLASNPRLVKEADALQAAGYRTHVVAADLAASLRAMDQTILARARWSCTLVGRGTLPGYAFLTFLQRGSQWLLGKGWVKWGGVPLAVTAHHRLTRKLGNVAAGIPADLYHAHNLGALPAAAHAAKSNGAKLGFDAEDFHSGELTEEQESRGSHAARQILEASFLSRCDLLTAASPGIAAEYHRLYGVTMQTILNVFPLDEAPVQPKEPRGDGFLRLYWFSQTIGGGRGLEPLVAALGRMKQPTRLYLRGKPADGFLDHLRELALREGLKDVIEVLPVTPPGDLIRESAGFDLGLGLEMNHPRNRAICLTNKIFVYLLAGLPVLLSRTPAQETISEELGLAARLIDTDDAEATARTLDQFAMDAPARRIASAAAWKLGREHYNWNLEQTRFLGWIRATLDVPVKPGIAPVTPAE